MTKSFDSTLMFFCQPGVVCLDILFLGDWGKSIYFGVKSIYLEYWFFIGRMPGRRFRA